jgi:glycosyltransferase involved in cell wall biosynthesis
MSESVAIVTVNWNTKLLLDLLLQSIKRYTPEPHTMYVFDNASKDGSAKLVERIDDVVLIRSEENVGHVGGLNELARIVPEDIMLCLDTDSHVYRSGWLPALVSHLGPQVKAVGYQSGYAGDPKLVARCLHAFGLLVDLRPFRAAGIEPDFGPLVRDGEQIVDVAGQVSLAIEELGYETKALMTDEETKNVPAELRRYPGLSGREYHDGYGTYFIHHLFYGSRPYLRQRTVSDLYRLLRAAYPNVEPGRRAGPALAAYYARCLATPSLAPTVLRSAWRR